MKLKAEKILITSISLLCLIYLLTGLIYKPIISNDAVKGMLSLHNYLHGSAWNKVLGLSADGSHIISKELTWWAPGQYQIPYLVSKLLFVNIGNAVVILMFASVCGGCYFYFKLFRLSGLKNVVVLSALLILLLQRFMNMFFVQYTSSDLLLFFYSPFYLYGYYKLTKNYPRQLVIKISLLTALNLVGLFIKNSFAIFEVAFQVFLVFEYFFNRQPAGSVSFPKQQQASLFKKAVILAPFVWAGILNYYFFLSLGETPGTGYGLLLTVPGILMGIFLPVAEVLFASLSISGIYGNLYDKIDISKALTYSGILVFFLVIGCVFYRKRTVLVELFKKDIIFRLAIIVSGMYVLFWLSFAIRKSVVSNEDRLYLPATVMLFFYLLNFSFTSISRLRFLYFAFVSISVVYGVLTFAYRIKTYSNNGSVFSKDQLLKGFKVYSKGENVEPDLDKISGYVSSHFPEKAMLISNPDIAFELKVNNQFVFIKDLLLPEKQYFNKSDAYVVLVQNGKDNIPEGLTEIYTSGKFVLYKPN